MQKIETSLRAEISRHRRTQNALLILGQEQEREARLTAEAYCRVARTWIRSAEKCIETPSLRYAHVYAWLDGRICRIVPVAIRLRDGIG